MYDFLEQSTRLMQQAAGIGGLDQTAVALLAAPARVVTFRIPLKMDHGSCRIFDASRVRYNDALGPSRDGTRISADLDLEEVKALALSMAFKHAAGLIHAGGGKGGITADPRTLSRWEFERRCRAYIRYLRPAGADYDVPGADIGTNLQTMAWMLDEYEQITGRHAPGTINDKPPILGGYAATGRGTFDVFKEAAEETGLEIEGTRIAVQGFGQEGAVAAAIFQEVGCRVIAVSDSRRTGKLKRTRARPAGGDSAVSCDAGRPPAFCRSAARQVLHGAGPAAHRNNKGLTGGAGIRCPGGAASAR